MPRRKPTITDADNRIAGAAPDIPLDFHIRELRLSVGSSGDGIGGITNHRRADAILRGGRRLFFCRVIPKDGLSPQLFEAEAVEYFLHLIRGYIREIDGPA